MPFRGGNEGVPLYFTSTTDADLQCACTGKQLIVPDLVEIGSLISSAITPL